MRRTSREKRIYFDNGKVVAGLSDQPAEFYGQYLLLNGYLDEGTLLRLIDLCRERRKRLGKVLEEEGVLSVREVQRTLREHLEDLILDIFLWKHGVFVFKADPAPAEEIIAEPIDTVGLAFEGARWTDEYNRLRQTFEHDNYVLGVSSGSQEDVVAARERRILNAADGVRTIGEMFPYVNGSYYRFLQAVYDLYKAGVLKIVDIRQDAGLSTVEMPLQDVLLEQATAESTRGTRRYMSSPVGLLERFVPVWTNPPANDEMKRLPERVQELYRSFDGRRRLAEILSEDEEDWEREMELLMLQISKEALALLPAPLDELRNVKKSPGSWVTLFP